MATTLDEFLLEIDEWKQSALDDLMSIPEEQRAAKLREARTWFEARMGRVFKEAPVPVTNHESTQQ